MAGKQTPTNPYAFSLRTTVRPVTHRMFGNTHELTICCADEPRRSGRATKGQHTRKDSPEPTPAKQAKQKGTKKKTKEDEEEDKEEVIRCVCGTEADLAYVCCDRCDAWQHIECMGLDPDLDWESKKYFCEQCKPQNHKTLLEQIARGERPWEKLFEADKKKKGKKGGATRKSRKSEVQSEEPATPKPESSQPDQPTPPVVKQEPDVRNGGEVETKVSLDMLLVAVWSNPYP